MPMISGSKSPADQAALYFTAGISVTTAIFSWDAARLEVLLIRRRFAPEAGEWALPGVMLHPEDDVNEVRDYLIASVTGLQGVYTKAIRAFAGKGRHPLGRVINLGYYAAVRKSDARPQPSQFATEARWFPVDAVPDLVFDHQDVLASALRRLRKRMRRHPVAFLLLPEKFTMPDLHQLFQTVYARKIDKRNFSRKALQSHLVTDLGEKKMAPEHAGRLPRLYRFEWEAYRTEKGGKIRFDY